MATSVSGNKYWASTSANPILPYTVSNVYGEWIVPRTKAGVTGFIADTSVWVGMDGYDSNTVEQVGTSSTYDPSTGQTAYYAWWEMYPKFSHPINAMNVNPGDKISAYVWFTPAGNSQAVLDRGTFKLSLTDMTTGKSFTITQGPFKPDFYLRSSAEWIVERAAFFDRKTKQAYFAELAEFDTSITFTNCKATVSTYGSNPIHYDRMWIRAPYTGGGGYVDGTAPLSRNIPLPRPPLESETSSMAVPSPSLGFHTVQRLLVSGHVRIQKGHYSAHSILTLSFFPTCHE